MAVLGLRFCARAFSSCGKRGPLFIMVRRPLTIVASLLRSTGSRRAGSVIVAHGPSCSTACGIFPDQGSNPCAPHWQADSQPLRHQGSPLLKSLFHPHSDVRGIQHQGYSQIFIGDPLFSLWKLRIFSLFLDREFHVASLSLCVWVCVAGYLGEGGFDSEADFLCS